MEFLLNAVLKKSINNISVKSQYSLDKLKYDEKQSVLDIFSVINDDEYVNVEMQNSPHKNFADRIQIYATKLQFSLLKKGQSYDKINIIHEIVFCNFILFDDVEKVHSTWQIREDTYLNKILKGIAYHFIEIPKFRESNPDFNDELNQLLAIIDGSNEEWIKEAMKMNPKIKEIKKQVDDFLVDDEAKMLYELSKEKWEFDKQCYIQDAKEEGFEEGIAEGKIEGKIEGKEEGLEDVAKELLKKGFTISLIAEVTKLKKEKIKSLA